MTKSPERKLLTSNGRLPNGNWPESDLVAWVPERHFKSERARADRLRSALLRVIRVTDAHVDHDIAKADLQSDLGYIRRIARRAVGDDT